MNFEDLKGKYLKGIMDARNVGGGTNHGVYLFLKDKTVAILSDNQDYSYYTNWRIEEIDKEKLGLFEFPLINFEFFSLGLSNARINIYINFADFVFFYNNGFGKRKRTSQEIAITQIQCVSTDTNFRFKTPVFLQNNWWERFSCLFL